MTEWIRVQDKMPDYGLPVLACVQYLDAEWDFDNGGYNDKKVFWTKPVVIKARRTGDNSFSCGGKVMNWMPEPKPPEEQ